MRKAIAGLTTLCLGLSLAVASVPPAGAAPPPGGPAVTEPPQNMSGVDVPHTGTRIRVVSQDGTSMRIRVTTAGNGAA